MLVPAPNDGAVFVPPNSEVEVDGALLNENAMLVMVVTQTGAWTIRPASLKEKTLVDKYSDWQSPSSSYIIGTSYFNSLVQRQEF